MHSKVQNWTFCISIMVRRRYTHILISLDYRHELMHSLCYTCMFYKSMVIIGLHELICYPLSQTGSISFIFKTANLFLNDSSIKCIQLSVCISLSRFWFIYMYIYLYSPVRLCIGDIWYVYLRKKGNSRLNGKVNYELKSNLFLLLSIYNI